MKKRGYILPKNTCHCHDIKRIVSIKGVKNRAVTFYFRWQRAPRLKILWVLRRHYRSSFCWKYKFARLVVGGSALPLWRGARLVAIVSIGYGLALLWDALVGVPKHLVLSKLKTTNSSKYLPLPRLCFLPKYLLLPNPFVTFLFLGSSASCSTASSSTCWDRWANIFGIAGVLDTLDLVCAFLTQ